MSLILADSKETDKIQTNREFDPGSGRTLAARLTHASRTDFIETEASADEEIKLVANG